MANYLPKIVSLVIIYPLEFLHTRKVVGTRPNLDDVVRKEGWQVLYSGFFLSAFARLCHDMLKGLFTAFSQTHPPGTFIDRGYAPSTSSYRLTFSEFIAAVIVIEMLAYHCLTTVSMSMRVRAGTSYAYKGPWDAFKSYIRDNGFLSLARGYHLLIPGLFVEGALGGF